MFIEVRRAIKVSSWFLDKIFSFTKLSRGATEIEIKEIIQFCLTSVISLTLLIVAIYVLLSQKYDASMHKWATGVIGALIGYWLK